MLREGKHLKIFWTIIRAYAVLVVDVLCRQKRSSDHRLHDVSMLPDSPSAHVDNSISPSIKTPFCLRLIAAMGLTSTIETPKSLASLPSVCTANRNSCIALRKAIAVFLEIAFLRHESIILQYVTFTSLHAEGN